MALGLSSQTPPMVNVEQVSLGSASSGNCFLAALPLSPSFPFHIATDLPLFYLNQQDIFYFTQQYTTQDTGDSSVIRKNGQSHREGKGIGSMMTDAYA